MGTLRHLVPQSRKRTLESPFPKHRLSLSSMPLERKVMAQQSIHIFGNKVGEQWYASMFSSQGQLGIKT